MVPFGISGIDEVWDMVQLARSPHSSSAHAVGAPAAAGPRKGRLGLLTHWVGLVLLLPFLIVWFCLYRWSPDPP